MNHSASQNITAKVFKRSGLLSMARLLQVAVTFIIFWLFSLRLPKDIYGIYQKAFVLVSFFSGLCCLGLPIIIASLPVTGTGRYIRFILQRSKFVYSAIIAAVLVFIIFFSDFISLQARVTALMLIFFNAVYLVLESYLVKLQRDRYVFYNNVLYSAFYFTLHYAAVMQPTFDLAQLLLGLCLLSFARLPLLLFFNRPVLLTDRLTAVETVADTHYFTQWKFLSLNEAMDIFSRQVDKLFLLLLLTAGSFAVYFNGSYEIPLIGILISTTGTFITMHTVQQQNNEAIRQLLTQSTLILACILFPLFFFLFFNAEALFYIFFKDDYRDSVPIFLISCCIIPLRIMNYTAILQGYHEAKKILTGSITGLLVKIVLSIVLYMTWGVRGVALAFILGTLTQIIYYLLHTSRLLNSRFSKLLPFAKLLFLFITTGAIIFTSTLFLKNFSAAALLVIQAIIFLVAMAAGLFLILKNQRR